MLLRNFKIFYFLRTPLCWKNSAMDFRGSFYLYKNFSNESKITINSNVEVIRSKAEVIDVVEEKFKYKEIIDNEVEEHDIFEGINLERGINGVFEIEDLVSLLNKENAENIFVASVPPDKKYVDYICIVSGKSQRHMLAIAEFVRRVYKKKCDIYDSVPKIEGESSKDWIALDLGNIALHIFSREARDRYDLDMLWSVGSKFDNESRKEDPIVEILEKHTIYLKDLKPAS